MKFLSVHLGYALRDEDLRKNLRALLKYLLFLIAVIAVYSILFHVIMINVEGQDHSWITGIYWTLTVMSTLGFGDITFTTDLGRAFSVVVLMSGIILLLIVLPFAFIRYFYAPWLEAQIRKRVPDTVPPGTHGHVVFIDWDTISQDMAPRLAGEGIPYFVVTEEGTKASALYDDGIATVRGKVDDLETFERLNAGAARLIVLNRDDLMNTNVALTVRGVSADVPLVAFAENEHSVDILELGGCDHVLPLKRILGEQLANRVNAGHAQAHVIGRYRDLVIAEFSVHGTPLVGKTLQDSRLREIAGVSVLGLWERSQILPARPDVVFSDLALPVVAGSQEAIDRLDEFLYIYDTNWNPVIILGGGKVGRAAARSLKQRGIPVHMVERNPDLAERIGDLPDRLIIGDAADRDVMHAVGIENAPSVLLTTNRDETNIYLAAYTRRISPEAQIVSRITHDRNLPSIQRAGADLTLSYGTLGVETLLSLLHDRPTIILGQGIGFHDIPCPKALEGLTLVETEIGARTGLTVVGLEVEGALITDPDASSVLVPGCTLLTIGSEAQLEAFRKAYP
ncbi:MAG: NAD-binding protein [Gemmatimonadota bacterium]|nr:NAD-binding protein [Gemmatimonadota bacterium]